MKIRQYFFYILMAATLFNVCMSNIARADPFEDAQTAYSKSDYVTAMKIWSILANKGDADAQEAVGNLYQNGLGTERDSVQAYKWYILAVASGNSDAAAELAILAKKMTPQQIVDAEGLAKEWKIKRKQKVDDADE